MTFKDFGFDKNLIKILEMIKVYQPNDFQVKCLKAINDNKNILATSKTNSGKTLTYLMSIVNDCCINQTNDIRGIVVVPTKELCRHVFTFVKKLSTYTSVKAATLYGGFDKQKQLQYLKNNKNIIIATPGRLLEFLEENLINASNIKCLVLDEYDELLNSNLKEAVVKITKMLKPQVSLLFSASKNIDVSDVVTKYDLVTNNDCEKKTNINNYYFITNHKEELLLNHLKSNDIFCALVFCNTKKQVEYIYNLLNENNILCDYIHSNLDNTIRMRATNKFKSGKIQVLVTTNLLSRGLGFKHLTHVINYDVAENNDIYLQRVGRSGRFQIQGCIYNYGYKKEEAKIKTICSELNFALERKS